MCVNLVRANATVIVLRCFAFTFGVFGVYCRLNRFSCIPIIYKNKNYLIYFFTIFSKNGTYIHAAITCMYGCMHVGMYV